MKMKPIMIVMILLMLISLIFAYQGLSMHLRVPAEEAKFHELQTNYFNNNTKAQRDSAPANSGLTQQLAQIQNYPSSLLELKLVGVGRILSGIFVLLFGILIALIMMPVRLGKIIKGN